MNRYLNLRTISRTALIAALAMLAGCGKNGAPMTTFAPKSDLAQWIVNLYWEITGLDLFVLATVVVAFTLAVFFFSNRVGEAGPASSVASDLLLEVAWTVGPALILLAISIPTVRLVFRSQPQRLPPGNRLQITVVAHQWWWEFHVDDASKVTTANELHIPSNRPIRLKLVSNDVIHSFWVPALGGKRDVVPGQINYIDLVATVPGEYYGQCAEFCGLSHANMRMRVIVDSQTDFAKWEKAQQANPVVSAPTSPAGVGAQIFANSPCTTCHAIKGVSKGYVGPDLTHLASRRTIASGLFDNDPKDLAEWITNPDRMKPGAEMPPFGISGDQLNDLVAYLESLK